MVSFYASGMGERSVLLLFCSIAGRVGGRCGWVGGWVFGRLGGWMGGSMGLGGFYGFVRMRVALWLCPFGLYGTRSVSNSYISCL